MDIYSLFGSQSWIQFTLFQFGPHNILVDSQIDQNPTRSESTGPIFESQTKTENDDIFDYMFWVYKSPYM